MTVGTGISCALVIDGQPFTGARGATIGRNFAPAANTFGFTAVNGVTSTNVRMWGFGVVQNFAASATDLYVGYRHFDADIKCVAANDAFGNVCAGASAPVGTLPATKTLPTDGIDVIVMGARVLF